MEDSKLTKKDAIALAILLAIGLPVHVWQDEIEDAILVPRDIRATVELMDGGRDPSKQQLSRLSEWMEANPEAWNRYCD